VRPPVALTQAPALFPQALVANSSQDPVLEQRRLAWPHYPSQCHKEGVKHPGTPEALAGSNPPHP
jgi:hypothetical protein